MTGGDKDSDDQQREQMAVLLLRTDSTHWRKAVRSRSASYKTKRLLKSRQQPISNKQSHGNMHKEMSKKQKDIGLTCFAGNKAIVERHCVFCDVANDGWKE